MCEPKAAEEVVRAFEDLIIAIDNLSVKLNDHERNLCGRVFINAAASTVLISENSIGLASVMESMRIGAGVEYSRKFMDHHNSSPTVQQYNPINPNRN